MKALRFVTVTVFAGAMLMGSTAALAQGHDHGDPVKAAAADSSSAAANTPSAAAKPAPTEAQKSFAELKTLAGTWRGKVTMDPPMKGMGEAELELTMRVASRGNTIVHEFQVADTPFDAAKYDHPITMLYLDEDRLLLTHYCDAGNRPRMAGKLDPDGKTVVFDFLDVAGPTSHGNMHDAKFTLIDENHHREEWSFVLPGNKVIHAHMDLVRKPETIAKAAK